MLNEICSPELVAEILRDQAREYDCNKCKNKVKIKFVNLPQSQHFFVLVIDLKEGFD